MSNYYSYFGSCNADRIYGSGNYTSHASTNNFLEYSPGSGNILITLHGSMLSIKPFFIKKWGLMFISPEFINVELGELEDDLYRIIAIHNFHAEDCNPRLNECLTGIFLARQINNRWEEAEDHPIECRTIEQLGSVDTRLKRLENL